MGESGASCFHTLSATTRDIAKPDWDKERVGKICTAAESFANLKASILKLCKLPASHCTMEQVETLERISYQIQEIQDRTYMIHPIGRVRK